MYDLSQREIRFLRTELADDALMTMKTNTKLYSVTKGRCMTKAEIAGTSVMPCTKHFARGLIDSSPISRLLVGLIITILDSKARMARAPLIDVADLSYSSTVRLVGNGMSVPCAGVLLLLVILFVEKKPKT